MTRTITTTPHSITSDQFGTEINEGKLTDARSKTDKTLTITSVLVLGFLGFLGFNDRLVTL
jgi:hypothetical protein